MLRHRHAEPQTLKTLRRETAPPSLSRRGNATTTTPAESTTSGPSRGASKELWAAKHKSSLDTRKHKTKLCSGTNLRQRLS